MRRLSDAVSTARYRGRTQLRRIGLAVSGGAIELFGSGAPNITMTTTAAVTAGRLVEISGDRSIRHAQSSSQKVLGVAKQTGSAVGDKIAVATGGVWNLTAKGNIAAGAKVVASSDNNGTVASFGTLDVTATPTETTIEAGFTLEGAVVGIALAAIDDGDEGPVLLRGLS